MKKLDEMTTEEINALPENVLNDLIEASLKSGESNPGNMTDEEYLKELQAQCIADGRKPLPTLEAYRGQKFNTLTPIPTDTAVRTRFAEPGQVCGRGRVRIVSPAQIKFIRSLLTTRYYKPIMGEKWFTSMAARLNITSHATFLVQVEFISLKGASTLIDALLACPFQKAHDPAIVGEPMASDAQKGFLTTLLADKEHSLTVDVETLTKKTASKLIGELKELPRKATPTPTKDELKSVMGLYELAGEYYRMKKARSGNHFYAEKLTDLETGAWEYAKGFARKVPAEGRKLSLEEGEKFSALLGSCCMCSRELTATVNGVGPAARFIGPICEAKYFG